jgi:holo-[acyl-carrier protein] synthase
MLGIGIDLLSVSRITQMPLMKQHRLAKRILSPSEFLEFTKSHQPSLFLATRFSCKESAYKALYPLYELSWKEVSISKQGKKPILEFHSSVYQSLGFQLNAHLSISHDLTIDSLTSIVYLVKKL